MFNLNKCNVLLSSIDNQVCIETIILNQIRLKHMLMIKANMFIKENKFIKEK